MCGTLGCECGDVDCRWYCYTCKWCKYWAPIKFNTNGDVVSPPDLVARLAQQSNEKE